MRNFKQRSYHVRKLEALYCRHHMWIYIYLKPGTQESILPSVFPQKISTTYQNYCRITEFKTSKEDFQIRKKKEEKKIIFKYICVLSYITLVFNLTIIVGIIKRHCKYRVNATAYSQMANRQPGRRGSSSSQ